jgi:hypothetical protein
MSRSTTARRPAALVLAGAGALLALTGCSMGTPSVPAADIADLAAGALEEEVGERPDEMDCGSEDVELVEGATVECTLTHGGESLPATVTITSVEGNDYSIDVQVAEAA